MRSLGLPLLLFLLLLACGGAGAPSGGTGGTGGEDPFPGGEGGVATPCPPLEGYDVPSCGETGCWEHPRPAPMDVEQVLVDENRHLWIAGKGSPPLRYNGKRWSIVGEGLPSPTAKIADLVKNDDTLWALQDGEIFRWEEGLWESIPRPFLGPPHAIWGSGTDLWAAGPQVRRYRDQWESFSVVGYGPFHAIWGSGPEDVWVVGAQGAVFRFLQGAWMHVPTETSTSLRSIWGTGAGVEGGGGRYEIWVGGEAGLLLRWTGEGFAPYELPTGAAILDIAGNGPDDVLALGYDAFNDDWHLFHRSEVNWQRLALPEGIVPISLWPSSQGVWVGGKGAALGLWDGNCLRVQPGTSDEVRDVWAGQWAVGARGLLLRRTEAGWERRESGTEEDLNAVWSWGGEIWLAGNGGLLLRGGEKGFREVLGTEGRDLLALHGSEGGSLWIGANDGNIFRADGRTLRRTPTPTSWPILSIAAFDDEAWATTEMGEVLHWDGGHWQFQRHALGRPIVFGTGPQDLWLAGFEGEVALLEHHSSSRWKMASRGGSTTIYAIAGDDDELYVAQSPNILRRWDGGTWTDHYLGVRPRALALDGDDLWILTAANLLRWRDGAVVDVYSSQPTLTALHVVEGEVWVGTEDGRIGILDLEGLTLGSPTGHAIRAIAGPRDNLWAVGDEASAFRRTGGSWESQQTGTELDFRDVVVRENRVWIATSSGILMRDFADQEPASSWRWYPGAPANLGVLWAKEEGPLYASSKNGGVFALDPDGQDVYFTIHPLFVAHAIGKGLGMHYFGGPPDQNGNHFYRFEGWTTESLQMGVTIPATAATFLGQRKAIVAQGDRFLSLDPNGAQKPLGPTFGEVRDFSRQAESFHPTAIGSTGGIMKLHLVE